LPLGLVAEVTANGGSLPQLEEISKKKKWLTRANGVKFSIIWFFIWFFITMLTAIGDGGDAVAVIFIIGLFGSVFIMLMSLLFLGKAPKNVPFQADVHSNSSIPQNTFGQPARQNALPPQQTQIAQDYVSPQTAGMWKAPDTGDLVSPGSVTEGTTKLLSKEEHESGTKYFDKK
jgi:hypothetical protein